MNGDVNTRVKPRKHSFWAWKIKNSFSHSFVACWVSVESLGLWPIFLENVQRFLQISNVKPCNITQMLSEKDTFSVRCVLTRNGSLATPALLLLFFSHFNWEQMRDYACLCFSAPPPLPPPPPEPDIIYICHLPPTRREGSRVLINGWQNPDMGSAAWWRTGWEGFSG